MVDPKKIRMLVEMMAEHDLAEICLRDGEEEIRLKRSRPNLPPDAAVGDQPTQVVVPSPMMVPQYQAVAPAAAPSTVRPEEPPATEEDAELATIDSPMVGTFYTASDPDSPPFADVGDKVTADTVVCIVEAMKVFNEIKAGVSGTIEKTLIKNEEPVEFGQCLFLVRPD